jgi:hypothetical protein
MAITEQPMAPARTASGRDTVAFRLATAGIALYVIDDAFAHPERGAAAGDHIVSGLVPLALLALLALAYPRWRAGARGAVALVLGVLAVTAGVADGVRHIAVDALGGDDLSALLAGACGIALLALGAVVLWRSRRTGGTRRRRIGVRAGRGLAAFVLAWLVVVPIGVAIVATHKARSPVATADLGAPYERVTLTTGDGLHLAGWYVPSRNRAAVIAFPGRTGPVPHARMLVRHGYGVLLLDRRGEGESDGDFNAFGWSGEADIAAAIAFLQRRPDVDDERIGGLGLSVGGELLLAAAARDRDLRAVVSEGAGIRSLAEHLQTPDVGALQRWVTPWLVETGAIAVLSNSAPPDDLTELVAKITPRPVLLIQARDGNGGEELNSVYAEAIGPSASLWQVDAGHTGALAADAQAYERRVVGFLDGALLGDLRSGSADATR